MIDFSAYIIEHTRDFKESEWLFANLSPSPNCNSHEVHSEIRKE